MSEAVSCMTCLVLRDGYGRDSEIGTHVDKEGVVHHVSRDSFARDRAHILCLIDREWSSGRQQVPWCDPS